MLSLAMPGRRHCDLKVWQDAIQLVKHVYFVSQNWPAQELYGLTGQIRRAAVSVPANIAEGHGRRSDNEFARFLNIAHGSLMELETHAVIAKELGYISPTQLTETLERSINLGKMLYGLLRSIKTE
jgi:four helix bundle protein